MTKIKAETIPFSTGHLDFFIPLHNYRGLGKWIGFMLQNPHVYMETIVKGFDVISISGLTIIHPGMGEVWSLPSVKMLDHKADYYKETRKLIEDKCEKKYQCKRVQASIAKSDTISINWIEHLGFEREGLMSKWNLHEDFYLYSKVNLWDLEQ